MKRPATIENAMNSALMELDQARTILVSAMEKVDHLTELINEMNNAHHDIIKTVCNYYCLEVDEMMQTSRKREIIYPRQMAMYFMCLYSRMSLSAIGKIFGKDHSTVINSRTQIANLLSYDRQTIAEYNFIKKQLMYHGK